MNYLFSAKKITYKLTPSVEELIELKVKLPTLLEYMYVSNNNLVIEDVRQDIRHLATYQYKLIELDDGDVLIELPANNHISYTFHIISAFLNASKIKYYIQEVFYEVVIESASLVSPINTFNGLQRTDIHIFETVYDADVENTLISWRTTYANCENVRVQDYESLISKDEDLTTANINDDILKTVYGQACMYTDYCYLISYEELFTELNMKTLMA